MEDLKLTTIKELSTTKTDWVVEVRLTKKGQERTFTKNSRKSTLLPLEFTDREGTTISTVLFGSRLNNHLEKLKTGNCYLIADGTLRQVNEQFAKNCYKFTLSLNDRSYIKEIPDKENIPKFVKEFTPISHIEDLPIASYINVIGIARYISALITLNLRDKTEILLRKLKLFDETGEFIIIALWRNAANVFLEENKVVAFEGMRVSQYKNVKRLNSTDNTTVIQYIYDYDTTNLQNWANSHSYSATSCSSSDDSSQKFKNTHEIIVFSSLIH